MEILRKQILKWATERPDYCLSLLLQYAPKFVKMVEEYDACEFVSVADDEVLNDTSKSIDLFEDIKTAS